MAIWVPEPVRKELGKGEQTSTRIPVHRYAVRPTQMTRNDILAIVGEFSRFCAPPGERPRGANVLLAQDAVGLAIWKTTIMALPAGNLAQKEAGWSHIWVLDAYARLVPDLLVDVGLYPALLLGVPGAWSGVMILNQRVARWGIENLDPHRPPRSEREETIRALAGLQANPGISPKEELAAARRARRYLMGWWARKHHIRGVPRPELDDLIHEVVVQGLPRRALYRRRDGSFGYDARGIRDGLRKSASGLFPSPGLPLEEEVVAEGDTDEEPRIPAAEVARHEERVRVVRAVRRIRDRLRGDAAGCAALEYLLGRHGFQAKKSRAELAEQFETTVDLLRGRELRVQSDLKRELEHPAA